ncbi:MAG: U32 family peptidase [Coriobacteriia bacterium]|nr:U32 family peptidase [Coriobacteriia bacterium]
MGVILAPVNGKGTAERLVKAGAQELYMGFYDPAWAETFGMGAALNRMSGFGQEANTLSFQELLEEVTNLQASLNDQHLESPRLYCVFNAAGYSATQLAYIRQHYLPHLREAGFAGIIVSGPDLIDAIHEQGMQALASTMCSIYNEELARYYLQRGIDRAILPRDLTLADIRSITAAVPQLEYEVFFMRNGCIFADSHCMGLHKAGCPSLCRSLRSAPAWNQYSAVGTQQPLNPWASAENDRLYREAFHQSACGLCALWRFEQMGISAYKVVGRGDNHTELFDDVTLSHANLRIAKDCATEAEYLQRMLRPEGIRWLCDNQGLSCYYPEVRF